MINTCHSITDKASSVTYVTWSNALLKSHEGAEHICKAALFPRSLPYFRCQNFGLTLLLMAS